MTWRINRAPFTQIACTNFRQISTQLVETVTRCWYEEILQGLDGGTGRRVGLKIRFSQGSESSILSPGTNKLCRKLDSCYGVERKSPTDSCIRSAEIVINARDHWSGVIGLGAMTRSPESKMTVLMLSGNWSGNTGRPSAPILGDAGVPPVICAKPRLK